MSSPATRPLATLSVVLVALAALTGCGSASSGKGDGEVVAAFYPLAWVAERVAGEHLHVVNLTQPGQEPHDLELGPGEVAQVQSAGLVITLDGLQPAVDAAVDEKDPAEVLEVSDAVHLQPFADHEEDGHEDEAPEEGHEDEHAHGDLDPHFWHDPLRMAEYGDALVASLSKVDPAHAADFKANAAALRTDLEALDREFTRGLATCERDLVVVNHDAFGYLARYGLHLEPIVGFSPDATPTAGQLQRLHELIRDEGVTTVFAETLVSRKTSQTLAEDLGIRADVLDPLEGLTDETADEDYLSLMRSNLAKLQEANACA